MAITASNVKFKDNSNTFTTLLDMIYPIGSIVCLYTSSTPANLFGGSWSEIKDRFLLEPSSSFTIGTLSGSSDFAAHSHTYWSVYSGTDTLKSCYQEVMGYGLYYGGGFTNRILVLPRAGVFTGSQGGENGVDEISTTTAGSGTNGNWPPHIYVYIWRRTA